MNGSKSHNSVTRPVSGGQFSADLSEITVLSLIRNIVASEMPTELPSFDFEGPNIVKRLLSNESPNSGIAADVTAEADHFAGLVEALQFVKLAAGTVAALLQMAKLLKQLSGPDPNQDDIIKLWRVKLVKAGVPQQQAGRVASQFYQEALSVIRGKS